VTRRLVNITLDNLSELPTPCRSCVFWELDPVAGERAHKTGCSDLEKEAWISDTLLEWGGCGKIAYVDSVPAGYVLFAPPAYAPRSQAFPTSPVSPDAVLLMTARLLPEFTGRGLGRMLVQAVAGEVARRGLKAIEAFGRHAAGERPHACVLPADYLLAVGFKTVRPHPQFPRLRLDLKATASWREDVEYALERLVSSISPTALSRG
jgi:GNAT superfamily N-acetyltransferase